MGKADVGSAKYQAKQLKALGLQKLRYYCQLCQKQCRDANGFKNHLALPSHMGRVSNLSESGKSSAVIDEFLAEFEGEFLRLLRVNHGTKKISANKFYQEYILNDKNHVHMNATRWTSLTAFVKYLGRAGKVRVEIPPETDDEFNLFIRLVDASAISTDSEKRRNLQTEEERLMKFLDSQVEMGKKLQKQAGEKRSRLPSLVTPQGGSSEAVVQQPVSISLRGLAKNKVLKKAAFGDDSDED